MGTDELDDVLSQLAAKNEELKEATAKARAEEELKRHPLKTPGSEYNSRFAEVLTVIKGISDSLEKTGISAPVSENEYYDERAGIHLKRCHMQVFTEKSGPMGDDIGFDPIINESRPGFDLEVSYRGDKRVVDLRGGDFENELRGLISAFLKGILKDISR